MELAYVIIPIVLLLIAVGGYYSYIRQKQRREELGQLAGQLGWQFDPGDDYEFDAHYPDFEMFQRGHSRYAYNSLTGALNIGGTAWPGRMGDYHYEETTSNGKETTTHHYEFSYLIVQLPFTTVPDLVIRREGMFDKLKSAFGFDDIDFESAEFSRRFFVASPDKKFAYDVIHPAMMEFMLANPSPGIFIRGGRCCLCDSSGTWLTEEFRGHLDWLRQFFELWPAHVTSQLQSQPAGG